MPTRTIDTSNPLFRFNSGSILKRARRKLNANVEGINVTLPGVTFRVKPVGLEQSVAREIVIRMKDRRVLNSKECCDNCIDEALDSLQKIRAMLVDQQVALKTIPDCALFFLTDLMLVGIKDFLTYEQRLKQIPQSPLFVPSHKDFRRPPEQREKYQAALEMLRAHLYRCLRQVYKVAGLNPEDIEMRLKYSDQWDLAAYKLPALA